MFEARLVAYVERRMPGLRLYPLLLPEDHVLPAAVYSATATRRRAHDGSTTGSVALRTDVWARTYEETARVTADLTAVLLEWQTAADQVARHDADAITFQPAVDAYRGSASFVVFTT